MAQLRNAGLQSCGVLAQGVELAAGGFPRISSLIGFVANANGGFEQFVFAGFAFAESIQVMNQGLFGLFLFSMQAKKTFASLGGGMTQ